MKSDLTTLLLVGILLSSKGSETCFPALHNLMSGSVGVSSSLLGLSLLKRHEDKTNSWFNLPNQRSHQVQARDLTLLGDPCSHDNLLQKSILLSSIFTIY